MSDQGALVKAVRQGAVAELVLDRPEALNAISSAMAHEIIEVAAVMAADASISAIVLSSSSERAFCAGADLKERSGLGEPDLLSQRPLMRATFAAIADLPQPSVAAVAGFALGGGLELALCCDVIVADEGAELGLPEVAVGFVPGGGGTQRLLRRVGTGKAAELVLSGRRVCTGEALLIGLVDRVVPRHGARAAAVELATLIAGNSPVATRAAKRAMRLGADRPMAEALEVEETAWNEVVSSPDRIEGIAAFVERRRPIWPSARKRGD